MTTATPATVALGPAEVLAWAVQIGRDGVTPESEAALAGLRGATSAAIGDAVDPAQSAQDPQRALGSIPPELAYSALTAAFCGRHPDLAMQWLLDAGLMQEILPELAATVAFSQEGGRRHKDVWEHTKAVVLQSVPRPQIRWAAVLHDIGKVPTRRFAGPGKVTFHGHAEEGARMFRRGPARRIAFPPALARDVELLILHHLRAGHYEPSWTDAAVRRFALEMGPHLRDVLDLSRADITSKRPGKRQRCLELVSELARRIDAIQVEDAKVPPLPAGLGDALMRALALPPGRHIGALRQRLEVLCAAGELAPGEPPEFYVDAVGRLGLLAGLEITPPPGLVRRSAPASDQEAGEAGEDLVARAGPGEGADGRRPADEASDR